MAGGNNNTSNAVRGVTTGNVGGQGIRQGGRGNSDVGSALGVRDPNRVTNNRTNPNNAPPSAAAAPTGNTKYTYVGLCQALNDYEQKLVQTGTVEQANIYEVQFAPDSLQNSALKIPGVTEKNMTPSIAPTSAGAIANPDQNSVDYKGLNRSISQGTQIVQFIEMTMRNSSFITSQQLYIKDPITGDTIPNALATSSGSTQWFKISLKAVPISDIIDKKRNDFAYHMTYIISPYGINQADSQFFPDSNFRGAHKVFNYWFTGENTQILHYEQSYNTLYHDALNGTAPDIVRDQNYLDVAAALQVQNKKIPATRTGQNDQGATNGANNPASSLADFLYSQSDQKTIDLKIIGDPAFMLQGEITGLSAANFNFDAFYPDGSINVDAQQAVFIVNWNSPADYNNTNGGPYQGSGLMNINAAGQDIFKASLMAAPAQQSAAYAALNVKSIFSKGKFEQELNGCLITNLGQQQLAGVTADINRNLNSNSTAQPTLNQPRPGTRAPNLQSESTDLGVLTTPITSNSLLSPVNPSIWTNGTAFNNIPVASANSSSIVSLALPHLANPSQLPFSNGLSVGTFNPASLGAQVFENTPVQVNTSSQIMAPTEDAGGN